MADVHDASKAPGMAGLTVLALATVAVSNAFGRRPAEQPARRAVARATEPPPPATGEGALPNAGGLAAAPVEHPPGLIGLGRSVVERFSRDNATLTAAGIAFYLLSSIFPGLAVLVSVYGVFGDPYEIQRQIASFNGLLPPEAIKLLDDGLQSFIKSSTGSHVSVALATSLIIALWTARASMASIMTGLNIAYEEVDKRSFVVQTLVSIGLTVGAILFAIVAIFSIAVVPALLAFLCLEAPVETLLQWGRWPLLALTVVFGFAVLYRFAPYRTHPRWRWITWGSAVATVLWMAGSFLFSFYVSHFGSYDATYGSLGAVIILLLWFWFSALVMILGAEIDSELDTRNTNGGAPMAGTAPSAGPPTGGDDRRRRCPDPPSSRKKRGGSSA